MAVDWLKIKTEYINGSVSQRALAAKYGVSASQVAKHSTDEKWVEAKEQAKSKIGAKLQQKTEEKIVENESETNAIKSRLKLNIFRQLEKMMDSADEMDGQDFRRLVQSYKDMCEVNDDKASDDRDVVNIIWDI